MPRHARSRTHPRRAPRWSPSVMTDPDFDALRAGISVTALATLVPAGIVGWHVAPGGNRPVQGQRIGPDQPETTSVAVPLVTPSAAAPVTTMLAIAGSRLNSLYAAVDVCRPV